VLPFRNPVILGISQLLGIMPGAYVGPIFSAYLMTRLTEGQPGVRHWRSAFLRVRIGWTWYVIALAGVPAAGRLRNRRTGDRYRDARPAGLPNRLGILLELVCPVSDFRAAVQGFIRVELERVTAEYQSLQRNHPHSRIAGVRGGC
jgi:hypothetical protein